MKKTTLVCDCCKKENEGVRNIRLFADRRPDGAGGMENYYYSFDLCPDCMVKALKYCTTYDAIRETLPLTHALAKNFNVHGEKGVI